MTTNKNVQFIHKGVLDYQAAWDFQTAIFNHTVQLKIDNRKAEEGAQKPTENFLIFLEHPHVYTIGKSGDQNNLLLNTDQLKSIHAVYHKINRGGDITYHGPGQIVGYPILDLDNFFTDIHQYMRYLEEAVILTLEAYGVKSGRVEGLTGVWIHDSDGSNPRKICALGVKSSRWVTMHGFAFNVNTDLRYFDHIVPCGIADKAVTSLQKELGQSVPMKEVEKILLEKIASLFQMKIIRK